MSITRLKQLVLPPTKPADVRDLDEWRSTEEKLGLMLPGDYRDFIFTYGTGLFARFFRVYNPFATGPMALFSSVQETCEWRRQTKKDFPDRVPYPIYPERQGILPWGNDENGHDYYWFTKGAPDDWTVLSDNVRGSGFAEHECSMTEYLLGVLLGRIKPLAEDCFTKEDHVFKPFACEAEA
jgi:hypothetical protein